MMKPRIRNPTLTQRHKTTKLQNHMIAKPLQRIAYKSRNLMLCMLISIPTLPVMDAVEKYVFADWEFLKFLTIAVVIDTLLGYYKHWKAKTLSSIGSNGLIEKFVLYSIVLVISHVMANFTVGGEPMPGAKYFTWLAYSGMMIREVLSVFENLGEICPTLPIKGILKRLRSFNNETGAFEKDTTDR